jgi:hypothetical protein
MAYKEDYYEEVDKLFGTIKTNPFVEKDGGNAVSQEEQGQIQPVGWVENADASDGSATVKIDSDGITITDGKLSVADANGNSIISGGVVKALTNDGAEVVIDGGGITITDGALTVSNPTGTVIIDGTSNMFKIIASGTIQHDFPGTSAFENSATGVTLTGLGVLATPPGQLGWTGTTLVATGLRDLGPALVFSLAEVYSALSSGGSPTHPIIGHRAFVQLRTLLNGSSIPVVSLGGVNVTASAKTFYSAYNVLKEAAF